MFCGGVRENADITLRQCCQYRGLARGKPVFDFLTFAHVFVHIFPETEIVTANYARVCADFVLDTGRVTVIHACVSRKHLLKYLVIMS
jgi:hypothetical protein